MAAVPRYGLPSVAPDVQLPPQRVDNPVGEAVARFGGMLAARGEQMAQQDLETEAKARDNQLASEFNDLLMNPQTGFLTAEQYQGKGALDNYPDVLSQARDRIQTLQSNLSPAASRLFGAAAQVRLNTFTQNVYAHTAQERTQWVVGTNNAIVAHAITDIDTFFNDPTRVAQNRVRIKAAVETAGRAQGWGPEQIQANTEHWLNEAGKAWLGAQPVEDRIRLLTGDQAPIGGASSTTIWDAIHTQEAGGRTSGVPTSTDGAVGPGQVTPATFAQFAKPDEVITNNADNIAVSQRIVADYTKRYGGDAARVAVAYFSGPGNVAPAGSPTPWLRNTHDGNGKYVSSYVTDVVGRLGGTAPTQARDSGTPVDDILPSERAALLYQYQAQARVDLGAQEHAERIARQATENALYAKFVKGDLTIPAVMDAPNLDYTTRKQFVDMLSASAGGIETKPGLFNELYKNLYLPAGDPHRINDASQLRTYAAQGLLAPKDFDILRSQIEDRDKPGSEGEALLTKNLLDAARRRFIGTEFQPINDPGGSMRLQAFTTWFIQARDAIRAKGESVTAWLDPNSPNSPDKQLPAFSGSVSDAIRAKVSALTPTAHAPPLPTPLAGGAHHYSWSPSRKQWRDDTTGALFDANGKAVP